MQVVILGSTGTCKHKVAGELTKKDGFQLEPAVQFEDGTKVTCFEQAYAMCERWKNARETTKRQEENDFLTIRSFWDTKVYVEALFRCRKITDNEQKTLIEFYRTMLKAVDPPHGVIYLHATEIQTHNLVSLRSGPPIDDEFEAAVRDCYTAHVAQIAIPVINVAVADDFTSMMEEVRFAMNSLRSSNAGAPSIWKRSYFK